MTVPSYVKEISVRSSSVIPEEEYCKMESPGISNSDGLHDNGLPSPMNRTKTMNNSKRSRLRLHCQETILDIVSAVLIFCYHLITFETFVVVVLAMGATLFYQFLNHGKYYSDVSWTLVSFAVISPMIMQIRQAFTRREYALTYIADIKSLTTNIFLANAYWQWNSKGFGRGGITASHEKKTLQTLKFLLSNLCSILKLPTITRGRHRFTRHGKREVQKTTVHYDFYSNQITSSIKLLHILVEDLKREGLPANEASRINQYHMMLQNAIEKLLNIKTYRTPQATRSFTRVFIHILPFFYGPYYVYISHGKDNSSKSVLFSLCFSIMTSLSMIGIFNVEKALEDPFTEDGLDDIHVESLFQRMQEELDLLRKAPNDGTLV